MGTGIWSFSVQGIGIFMSFITGNGNFLNATENGNCFLKIRTENSRCFVNEKWDFVTYFAGKMDLNPPSGLSLNLLNLIV